MLRIDARAVPGTRYLARSWPTHVVSPTFLVRPLVAHTTYVCVARYPSLLECPHIETPTMWLPWLALRALLCAPAHPSGIPSSDGPVVGSNSRPRNEALASAISGHLCVAWLVS